MLKIAEDFVCKSAPLTWRVSEAACRTGLVLSRMWNLHIDVNLRLKTENGGFTDWSADLDGVSRRNVLDGSSNVRMMILRN